MRVATTTMRQRDGSIADWVAPLLVFAVACLVYSVNLGRMAHPDEYHHILAAQGLVATGEPRIAEGLYTRVFLQTWLVAKSFGIFGESLAAARVPSLVATALLVALLFAWLRREAGTPAAWIGATLFGLSPFAVEMAQFCRFYALQSLAMFVTATVVFAAVKSPADPPWRRLFLFAVASLPALLAIYLQPTSMLGLLGLVLWATAAVGLPWLADPGVPRRRKLVVLSLVAAAAVAGLLLALATGIAGDLWRQYQWAPLFNQRGSDQFWYYHAWYSLLYPSLWPLTAILALFAVAVRPMAGGMALAVFAVGFLLNSFAASKGMRYIAYAQPFLFVLWGISLAALWPQLVGFARSVGDRLGVAIGELGAPAWPARVLLAGALAFLVVANAATVRTIALLADVTVPPEQPRTNWPAAREVLEPWLAAADIVVTTEELGHLYFLGRYDVRFSPSKLGELGDQQQREFGLDYRTGRPVIGTRESLERILDCYPRGIIVGPAAHWGRPELINGELAALITARTQPLELPRASHLRASVWDRPIATPAPTYCQGLPSFAERKSPAE